MDKKFTDIRKSIESDLMNNKFYGNDKIMNKNINELRKIRFEFLKMKIYPKAIQISNYGINLFSAKEYDNTQLIKNKDLVFILSKLADGMESDNPKYGVEKNIIDTFEQICNRPRDMGTNVQLYTDLSNAM